MSKAFLFYSALTLTVKIFYLTVLLCYFITFFYTPSGVGDIRKIVKAINFFIKSCRP